jgi:hypothetical protein
MEVRGTVMTDVIQQQGETDEAGMENHCGKAANLGRMR